MLNDGVSSVSRLTAHDEDILNRATLNEKIAVALVSIAEKLPRAHSNVELYNTADMEAALSRLNTCVLLFFRLCAR